MVSITEGQTPCEVLTALITKELCHKEVSSLFAVFLSFSCKFEVLFLSLPSDSDSLAYQNKQMKGL